MECGAEWCVGLPGPRLYEVTKVVVLRKDGTQRKEVAASSGRSLMNDRFGLFWGPNVTTDQEQLYTAENPAPRMILYDRCAERSAQVGGLVADGSGPEISMGGASAADPEEPVLYWNSPDRKSWKMLDLARIPDGVCSD